MQRPILQRLFGRDLMDALGVRIDSVPAGRTEWPLRTGGVAPAMTAEGEAKGFGGARVRDHDLEAEAADRRVSLDD